MAKVERDAKREERITMEIVVDALRSGRASNGLVLLLAEHYSIEDRQYAPYKWVRFIGIHLLELTRSHSNSELILFGYTHGNALLIVSRLIDEDGIND